MKRVFFVLALSAALSAPAFAADDKKLDAPPTGLSPTTTTLSHVLKAYTAATGRLVPGTRDTRQESWAFTKAGLAGTETLVRSGSDYHSHIVTGPISEDYGQLLGHAWHRFPGGMVTPTKSTDYTSFEMLLFMRNFDEALDPKNDVTVLGEVQSPKPAYVLQIKTTGDKHPDYAFYDKQTGLIDRFESVVDDTRIVLTYDDYRTTKGLTQPWHVHFTDGTASLDDDFVRKTLSIGDNVDSGQFGVPTSKFGFEYYNGHQALPSRVFEDEWNLDLGDNRYITVHAPTLVVRLNVAGRGLDFAVSAAAPRSLIDFDVAQQLNLPSYGKTSHAEGDAVPYDTILPAADLGGLLLRNWPLRATPFHYHISDTTKVVGMIGYDVLSSGVFKIDFVNGTFELFPTAQFDGAHPAAVKDASMLDVRFDDGMPFISGTIGSHTTDNILFDNDFDTSFVFGSLTNAYPDMFQDVVTGKSHGTTTIPFADSKGYGKDVQIWLARVPEFGFGPEHFANFQVVASDADLEGSGIDAVMGGDLLRFFDVYLDYPHNRIFLKPNSSFFKTFQIKAPK
jgi:hypothetical protein